jgi:SAM-dependent methyltransferase
VDNVNTERFSGKADVYARARPGYAAEAIDYIYRALPPRRSLRGLADAERGRELPGQAADNAVFADVGAGTGKFSELIARRGGEIFCVEPNGDMRTQLSLTLAAYPNAHITDGTAENTTLPDGCADAVVCAQAFHWFDPDAYRRECERILAPGGKIFIVYNSDRSVRGNELDWCESYAAHSALRNEREIARRAFFGGYVLTAEFPNPVRYDRSGFAAFMLSHSGSPSDGDEHYARFTGSVNAIFDRESVGGLLVREFVTTVYSDSRR